jgi:hypothetical protein
MTPVLWETDPVKAVYEDFETTLPSAVERAIRERAASS